MVRKLTAMAAALAVAATFGAVVGATPAAAHEDGVLDRLRAASAPVLRLGYRTDAAPFASDENGAAVGYTVDICRAVGDAVVRALPDANVRVEFAPVAADDRFDALAGGEIDLLCGATTVTLERRETMDFSLMTFVTGGVLLVPIGEIADAPETVGVLGGTTSETSLNRMLALRGADTDVVTVESHGEGVEQLKAGALDAYFGDRALLLEMLRENPGEFALSETVMTFEPYALPMRRGDTEFRLIVDRTIAQLLRTGGINPIYRDAFGGARPNSGLIAVYNLMALQD